MWKSLGPEEHKLCIQMRKWIEIARSYGRIGYGPNWLPTDADITKSALFERIRNGKEPLPFPPPTGYSCPWYALVEDQGPHALGGDDWVHFGSGNNLLPDKTVSVAQHIYDIVEVVGDRAYYIVDGVYIESLYKFKLWFDPNHPYGKKADGSWAYKGSWMIQNTMLS